MTSKQNGLILALSFFSADFVLAESLVTKPVITLVGAKNALSVVTQAPAIEQAHTVISVVDDGGHLIYLERSDGVASGMVQASIKKARTAAVYGLATKALEQKIAQGHPGLQNLPGILPLEGGVPVVINGQLAGAVGVAGGASTIDGALAEKVAAALVASAAQR